MVSIQVYCDGSITNADMLGPYESCITDTYVGRVMVLVPARDLGYIAPHHEGVVTRRGTPDSSYVEELAIRAALGVATRFGLEEVEVFSDCEGAVGYLWKSAGKVGRRREAEPHQVEAFELLRAPEREFRLSESALWTRVQRDTRRHAEAMTGGPAR